MSRPSIFRICVILAVLLLAPGCRSAVPSSSVQLAVMAAGSADRPSADVIGRAEISAAPVKDAYEALMRFRPDLLTRRSPAATADPDGGRLLVYVNGVQEGGVDVLRSIPARVVVEIRYLSASAVRDQFGPYHAAGVLAVRTNP